MFPPKSVPAKIIGLRYDSYVRHRALAENEYIISAFAECGGLLISASFPATHLRYACNFQLYFIPLFDGLGQLSRQGLSNDMLFLHKMTFFSALVLSAARRRPLDGVMVHALLTTPIIQSSKHQRLCSYSYRRSASSYQTTTRGRDSTSLDSSTHDDVTSSTSITYRRHRQVGEVALLRAGTQRRL